MPHYIDMTKGRAAFFSVKKPAWHELGKTLDHVPSSAEAIVESGLDFTVEKRQLLYPKTIKSFASGELAMVGESLGFIDNQFTTVRTDTNAALGIVSNEYHIIQNEKAFDFMDSLVQNKEVSYETAGSLKGGRIIFITAKIPKVIKLGQDDIVEPYLLFTSSHDGSASITVTYTPTRVVCWNTLSLALKDAKTKFTFKHSSKAKEKLNRAALILGAANQTTEYLGQVYEAMINTPMNDKNLSLFIAKAFLKTEQYEAFKDSQYTEVVSSLAKNKIKATTEYALSSNGGQQLDSCRGTLFGAYNAISGYFQNIAKFDNQETKFDNLFGGTSEGYVTKAFENALTLIN